MIPKYLIEAYKGFHDLKCSDVIITDEMAIKMIVADRPIDRLGVFLTWNGIIGYTEQIYGIARTQEYTL